MVMVYSTLRSSFIQSSKSSPRSLCKWLYRILLNQCRIYSFDMHMLYDLGDSQRSTYHLDRIMRDVSLYGLE